MVTFHHLRHVLHNLTKRFVINSTNNKRAKMEVTSKNFASKLKDMESSIDSATFITIDGEFTGLTNGDGNERNSALDTPAERYAKVRSSANKFLLVQFGLCTFHYDESKKSYTNRAFNVYVWPRPYNHAAPDTRFLCQTSSIDFLAKQKFDFNKLIYEGVAYLRPTDEQRLKDQLAEKQASRRQGTTNSSTPPTTFTPRQDVPVPEDQREFVDATLDKIQAWMDVEDAKEPLELDNCNPFQRRLLYQSVKSKFTSNNYTMETLVKSRSERVLVLTKVSEADKQERERSEMDDLDAAVGFAKIIRKVTESQKLVVGHNMLLDVCHTLQQFVAPLPEDYDEFKSLAKSALPHVCDTKLMASTSPFREDIPNSALEELLKTVSMTPFVMPDVKADRHHPGYRLGESTEKYHEAGYDAFITGLCFIAMTQRLAASMEKAEFAKAVQRPIESALLKPYLNKLHLMRIIDVPYMNLDGADLVPSREHVFHVTFPTEWRSNDLVQLFSPFGPVSLTWLTDSTAYVSLREHVQNAKMVMSTLNCSSIYSIMPYQQHKNMEALYINTGITPTLEKANLSFGSGSNGNKPQLESSAAALSKKRPASPEQDTYKRTKSVSEEKGEVAAQKKMFNEPPSWD